MGNTEQSIPAEMSFRAAVSHQPPVAKETVTSLMAFSRARKEAAPEISWTGCLDIDFSSFLIKTAFTFSSIFACS